MEEAFQLSLALMPRNINKLYIDQAMVYDEYGDRGVFAAYTPYGIKQIDSEFCTRIKDIKGGTKQAIERIQKARESDLAEASKGWGSEARRAGIQERFAEKMIHVGEDPEKLRNDILVNPHLHPCIKENLLENLDRALK